jgi:hypothetical protein
MKNKASTLADRLYQATYDSPYLRRADELRQTLFSARRFVLDERMSAFLTNLATAAFLRKNQEVAIGATLGSDGHYCEIMPGGRHNNVLIEQLRLAARLPHPITWIEYDFTAAERRQAELTGIARQGLYDGFLEGWLLQQHPQVETAFTAHVVNHVQPHLCRVLPWVLCWSTDDQPLPWGEELLDREMPGIVEGKHITTHVSERICGINQYRTAQVSAFLSPYVRYHGRTPQDATRTIANILNQMGGAVRRIWALLATVNDIPLLTGEIKASRGFMGRGSYKRFLDHQTITLRIPIEKDLRRFARHVVACARRRAHMVRGHWRMDWRYPPNPLCVHVWTVDQACKHCRGHRLWVSEHKRGDASLGIVMTDYKVTKSISSPQPGALL